jgi:hypothetical protein
MLLPLSLPGEGFSAFASISPAVPGAGQAGAAVAPKGAGAPTLGEAPRIASIA